MRALFYPRSSWKHSLLLLPQSWGKAVLLLLDRRSRCYPLSSSSFFPRPQLWHGMLLARTRTIPHPHYSPWVPFSRSTIKCCVDVLVLGALVEFISTTRSASLPFLPSSSTPRKIKAEPIIPHIKENARHASTASSPSLHVANTGTVILWTV